MVGVGGGGGGGGGESPGGPSGLKVIVRWETSDPLMEAFHNLEYSLLPKLHEWSKEFYVITVAGIPVTGRGGGGRRPTGAPQGERPPIDPKQMSDRLIRATSLKRKGKDPVSPVRVEMIRAGDQLIPMFFFLRNASITPEDKEVTFESVLGQVTVKSRFNLKDMHYNGKLSL